MKKLIILLGLAITGFAHEAVSSADTEAYKQKISSEVAEVDKYRSKIAEFEKSDKFTAELLKSDQPHEIRIGNPDAPYKIVEYMSLTCSHCKEFHENTFYKLKKEMIDEGKVYMRVRHFPLNGTAVKAAMILDCVKEDDKLAFMGALFKSQPQWGFVQNEAALIERLKTVSIIGGLTNDEFDKCYGNAELQDSILMSMKKAAEGLMVDSTPALYINGTRYLGARDFDSLKKAIEAMPAENVGEKTEPVKE